MSAEHRTVHSPLVYFSVYDPADINFATLKKYIEIPNVYFYFIYCQRPQTARSEKKRKLEFSHVANMYNHHDNFSVFTMFVNRGLCCERQPEANVKTRLVKFLA